MSDAPLRLAVDIGGSIGAGPDGSDVHMEGLYIPMLKLADQGRMNKTLPAMVRANTRQPVASEGDVYSLAACNDIGCERLNAMIPSVSRWGNGWWCIPRAAVASGRRRSRLR